MIDEIENQEKENEIFLRELRARKDKEELERIKKLPRWFLAHLVYREKIRRAENKETK